MTHKDVTDQVRFGRVDNECLPLERCICGAAWNPWMGPILGLNNEEDCPVCGRLYFFRVTLQVFQVIPEDQDPPQDTVLDVSGHTMDED